MSPPSGIWYDRTMMTYGLPRIMLGLACIAAFPIGALAIPAFSRQIHADCRTCHFQSSPALNAYGRAFEMNGFRETEKMRRQRLQREKRDQEKKAKQDSTVH
jgi:hypothetical protein